MNPKPYICVCVCIYIPADNNDRPVRPVRSCTCTRTHTCSHTQHMCIY